MQAQYLMFSLSIVTGKTNEAQHQLIVSTKCQYDLSRLKKVLKESLQPALIMHNMAVMEIIHLYTTEHDFPNG